MRQEGDKKGIRSMNEIGEQDEYPECVQEKGTRSMVSGDA